MRMRPEEGTWSIEEEEGKKRERERENTCTRKGKK